MTLTKVGVLALQGDFRKHLEALARLGVDAHEVRTAAQLDDVDAIVLPGGESTAISKLLETSGLFDALSKRYESQSLPTMGTCAGAILSASDVLDGLPEQRSFGILRAVVRRNGVGPQIASFEAGIDVEGLDRPFHAVFIRPPVVESCGEGVEVLAKQADRPVLCADGQHVFATFHPELTEDDRIHRLFLDRM